LVRAELARRLAEQAVSQAAAVTEAELAAFAVGRGLRATHSAAAPPDPPAAPETAPAQPSARDSPGRAGARAALLRRPDMLTGEALAGRLGVSRATVALRRAAGRLLALESGAKRGFRYPAWQADVVAEPALAAPFEDVLHRLRPRGPWATYEFLTEPSPALGGRTPLEVLAAGDSEPVRHALERFPARATVA
jgi:hypothetical protein